MADVPEIRASDAERERVATELREHAAEGRLDVDELDERLQQAYDARTRGDLEKLTADLPAAPPPKPSPPTVRERGWGLAERAGSYVGVMVILIIIWAADGRRLPVVHLAGDRMGPRAGDDGQDRPAVGWASAAAVARGCACAPLVASVGGAEPGPNSSPRRGQAVAGTAGRLLPRRDRRRAVLHSVV